MKKRSEDERLCYVVKTECREHFSIKMIGKTWYNRYKGAFEVPDGEDSTYFDFYPSYELAIAAMKKALMFFKSLAEPPVGYAEIPIREPRFIRIPRFERKFPCLDPNVHGYALSDEQMLARLVHYDRDNPIYHSEFLSDFDLGLDDEGSGEPIDDTLFD